ncbi:hypothetical protein MYP_1151 [Sporocytophaga myxococcoides]|uniref:Secretion system C-terminal sorting domain-containing protein n=1 Tax=Sporocytophaga myxococcoides TaxID=153721 RepID=A0A098LCP9_9BACT|nr:hypothetical protein MYP_1151 [Sporocytophaga myxococcoides]
MPLLLLLLALQREDAKAGIATTIDGQPKKANYYSWNYTFNTWEYTGVSEFEYDANNNLISELYFNSQGDTSSKKSYSYNDQGKETGNIAYRYVNNVFVASNKEIRTYDLKGYLVRFESFGSSDGVSWGWKEQTVYSTSNSTLEYPDIVEKYNWESGSKQLIKKYSNMVWTDFERERFSSGIIEERNVFGDDQRTTYTTVSEGIKIGWVEVYDSKTKTWSYSFDEVHTKDAQGNTFMIQQADYGSGPVLFSRISFPVDIKGNNTGYSYEVWFNNKWKFISSELTTNTYNSNGALTETIYEGKEVGSTDFQSTGINFKYRTVYEVDGEVTSSGQPSRNSGFQMAAYPNPCKNILNIEGVSKEDMQVYLFDMNNHLVLSTTISGGKGNVAIENVPSGIYILKVASQSGGINIQKIVKE